MADFISGLLGINEEDPLLAMLPPEQRAMLMRQGRTQGLQNLGAALLQAGGPSRVPTGIGSRFGGALMGAQEATQAGMDANLQRLMSVRRMQQEESQRQQMESTIAGLSEEDQRLYRLLGQTGFGQILSQRAKPQERKTATVGNRIVDTATGEVVYEAPSEKKPPKTREINLGSTILLINEETGETIKRFPVGMAPRAAAEPSYKPEVDASGRMVYVPQKPGLPILDQAGKPVVDYKPAMTSQQIKAKERLKGPQIVVDLLGEAENLVGKATGSYLGALYDMAGNVVGYSPEGQQAIQQLKAIETQLVLNMPRLEGPQSNFDAQLYKEAAGKIGDPTLPPPAKKAAIDIIKKINIKYGGAVDTATEGAIDAQKPSGASTSKALSARGRAALEKYK